ncbi:Cell division protein DamX [Vibrio chagasii]|uniref:SPOR domain-containing protein n=1 Tax=Vibrio splendidus TaxID=29497 RepID=UPI000E325CBA|nr:AAA family ATPase [Vibrio splendidus]CAH6783183.1 Cell division protein DamX [Vibrio chagasii]CAH6833583.1 Cell division protein DamX [Vibrio chagasii]CAH6980726.1 Cell division protein DamX [Vibrio chagasii]CAH6997915.1 Cell division protein DamX [Vibrio chagasii]CAH7036520.1 Cell division protein DamX [Vibrio chagasii]
MSLAHELRVLELESQVELLERLQLLTNFGSNLVTVAGKPGSGRSWLAQRYLEAWATEKNQCLLLCHPSQDDQQRRALILSQIVSDPLFNQHDSLSDSLARLLDGEPCSVVIVVDDAHRLSELLVSELWMLVLEAQANPQWTINIVLFSEIGHLDTLLTRLSYGQQHKPIDLEIDDLSQPEAEHFFESLVIRYVDDESETRVRRAFNKAQPLPGELMALGELKVEKRIIIRSIIGSPINIAIVVALLLLLIGGGYWWMFSQPTPDDKAQSLIAPIEQTVIPTFEVDSDSEQAGVEGVVDSEASTDISYQGADDDSSSLPPVVVEETASVGEVEQDQQRVVITSDVVDALLDDKAESADTSAIDAAVKKNTEVEANSQADAEAASTVDDESDLTESTPPTKKITFSFAREELQAISPRAYTLQLSAMTSLEDVQSFIEEYDLENKVRIYPTLRNDTKWFIITYQDYPTIQVARDAVSTLSKPLQQLEPWAKSMNQVHREIERAK